jgi:hypothetical protein
MADETKEAQKSRAERLHRQIDSIKEGDTSAARPGARPTPRDYIENKMRELAESESDSGDGDEDGSACETGKG